MFWPVAAVFFPGVLLSAGCGASPPQSIPSPVTARTSASVEGDEPRLEDREWGVIRSKSQGLKLALPEARAWRDVRPEAERGASWELHHEPTGSTLTVKRWRSSRLPQVEACRSELARTTVDLAAPDETNLVSSRDTKVPAGFTTRITLLALAGEARRLRGQAQAFSAGVGECIAMIARTECGSEVELAERLRLFDAALSHLRLIAIDDRVPDRASLPQ